MISEAVAPNQLFFFYCLCNELSAMYCCDEMVSREYSFSKDYTDIPRQLLEHAENPNMLKSIVTYAKQADVGIEDMSFEIKK